jgi:hypothetical protein
LVRLTYYFRRLAILNREVELTQKAEIFGSSGMWRCIFGWVVSGVWKESAAFETSAYGRRKTQFPVLEGMSFQGRRCKNFRPCIRQYNLFCYKYIIYYFELGVAAEKRMVAPAMRYRVRSLGVLRTFTRYKLRTYTWKWTKISFSTDFFYRSPYKSCTIKFFWLSSVYSLFVCLVSAGCQFTCQVVLTVPHASRITSASYIDNYFLTYQTGHAVSQLFEALYYKPDGRGFDSRWCLRNFSLT